jgi:2-oxoglutarate ferredoxin oxidoreductase subunit alpha
LKRDVSIVIAGAAGQGIETVADFMATVLKLSGYHVFVTREFMSRIRGGTNSLQLRICSERTAAYVRRTDLLVPLTEDAIRHLHKYRRIQEDTQVLGEEGIVGEQSGVDPDNVTKVDFSGIATEVGGKIYSNTVAAGVITSLFGVNLDIVRDYLERRFGDKGEDVVNENIDAYNRGVEIGNRLQHEGKLKFEVEKKDKVKDDILISGTESIGLGAIAGGCNFIASYPMSPSTGVLVFLSQQSKEFGIVVDQVEDEISGINKGLGAWYAGARAMITTSGGGFALMTEGLSLAGMTETPMVLHVAQRPGPATGLPTRTGQEDLKHVLGAAHGEFPRIVLTPGTYEEGFYLTQKAFNLADKYQVPVFVLTDQFFVDSSYNIPQFDISDLKVEKHIVKTNEDYQRYAITEDGISPRGIPGFGEGFVRADSDEHDEDGHITEDMNLRIEMVNKRLHKKTEAIKNDYVHPELVGDNDYKTLVIAWGSNYYVVKEALEHLDLDGIALLHFKQVYPLPSDVKKHFDKAEQVLAVENNATGQFCDLLLTELGVSISQEDMLLKYDGLPFPVEMVMEFIEEATERRR